MTVKGDVGATKERLKKSPMRAIITELTPGGFVKNVSHIDTQHCYLDFLLNEGLLGTGRDERDRYQAGYKLRALWFEFNTSGACCTNEKSGAGKHQFTSDEVTDADRAEEHYYRTFRRLPQKYHKIIFHICLSDLRGRGDEKAHEFIREALDALTGAI